MEELKKKSATPLKSKPNQSFEPFYPTPEASSLLLNHITNKDTIQKVRRSNSESSSNLEEIFSPVVKMELKQPQPSTG